MKKLFYLLMPAYMLTLQACDTDDDTPGLMRIDGAKLKVTFELPGKQSDRADGFVYQTPAEYQIGLHSVTLIGDPHTPDHTLFTEEDFTDAEVFNFTDGSLLFDLHEDTDIPDGNYASVELGIVYLQMRLQLSGTNTGVQWRNMRIYFCEFGDFKRGDVVEVSDEGTMMGWLFGRYEMPDFLPASPRDYAYTYPHNGEWWMFADKPGNLYGPSGNLSFWNSVPNPFSRHVLLSRQEGDGNIMVIDFNVADCWRFEDNNGDGYFGGQYINPQVPSAWVMELPVITVSFQD